MDIPRDWVEEALRIHLNSMEIPRGWGKENQPFLMEMQCKFSGGGCREKLENLMIFIYRSQVGWAENARELYESPINIMLGERGHSWQLGKFHENTSAGAGVRKPEDFHCSSLEICGGWVRKTLRIS